MNANKFSANTENKKSYYDIALADIKRLPNGRTATDGSKFTIGKKRFGTRNLNAYDFLCVSIAYKYVTNRDYLPDEYAHHAGRVIPVIVGGVVLDAFTSGLQAVDELRSAVGESIFDSLTKGDRENAVKNAFKFLDYTLNRDAWGARNNKTIAKTEILCAIDIDLIGALIRGDSEYAVLYDNSNGTQTSVICSVSPTLSAVFRNVQTSHKFAFGDENSARWKVFALYALNNPYSRIAPIVGVSEQRCSALNRETFAWLEAEIKRLWIRERDDDQPQTVRVLRWIKNH